MLINLLLVSPTSRQAGKQAGRQASKQAGKQGGRRKRESERESDVHVYVVVRCCLLLYSSVVALAVAMVNYIIVCC